MSPRLVPLALAGLLAVGCEPPKMVPVAPPGLEYQQVDTEKEEPAEALGEMRAAQVPTDAGAPAPGKASGKAAATPAPYTGPLAEPTEPGQATTTASGLKYETLKPGTGEQATPGRTAAVHYTGTLTNGTKFDSSRDRGQPFPVRLGAGEVIKGWDEGLAGMKVGEVRKLTIPPDLAYGAAGRPPKIPANSTLIFEVELVGVR